MEAVGAVGNPIDQGQYLGSTEAQPLGPGWLKVFSALDGVRGVTDRAQAIVGDVTDISDDVTGARRTIFELKRDKDEFGQDQFLEKVTVLRGDNVTQMWVIGAVALGALLLFSGR